MGTNYYIESNFCECCNRGTEEYHIGKSSMGWCFSLHVDKSEGVNNLGDVKSLIAQDGNIIIDGYRQVIEPIQMMQIITGRGIDGDRGKVPHGYDSWTEFHRLNHSEAGPNNLFRSTVDGSHCVGHGEGTYDYITGEFC